MNGNHRPTGVLFLSDPRGAPAGRIEDIAPTVLASLGIPAPPMDGTSLLGEGLAGPPLATSRDEKDYGPKAEGVIEKRLRELGYFE